MTATFFEIRAQKRKLPGHCSQCGKPWVGETRTCERCKERLRGQYFSRTVLREMVKRIGLLEMKVDRQKKAIERLQKKHDSARKVAYMQGMRNAAKKLCNPIAIPEPAPVDYSELAQMSHAYPRE